MNTYEIVKTEGEWALAQLGQTSVNDRENYNYYQGRLDAVSAILSQLSKEGASK
jgi:hypothetical protein